MTMSPSENSILSIQNFDYLKYGQDFDIIKNWFSSNDHMLEENYIIEKSIKLNYDILIINFQDRYSFNSLTLEEQIVVCDRKTALAKNFIKGGEYKKANKVIIAILQVVENTEFDEDKIHLRQIKINSLLN